MEAVHMNLHVTFVVTDRKSTNRSILLYYHKMIDTQTGISFPLPNLHEKTTLDNAGLL